MANIITETNFKADRFVAPSSRYINSDVVYYGPSNLITFKTYKKNDYPASKGDKFLIIKKGHEYRPDLVSFEFYGVVSYWWKIMEANGIMDILDFKAGRNIRLPANVTL